MYFILGTNGLLGSNVKTFMDNNGIAYRVVPFRMEDISNIRDLLVNELPKYLIICAGYCGDSSSLDCDQKNLYTYRTNVLYQMMLVDLCKNLNIKCVVFSSSLVYNESIQMVNRNRGDTIEMKNIYINSKKMLEDNIIFYDNVVCFRLSYIVSAKPASHNNCLISKLIRQFKSIHNNNVVLSVLGSLLPVMFNLLKDEHVGIYNLVNNGFITNDMILKIYNKYVDHAIQYECSTHQLNGYQQTFDICNNTKLRNLGYNIEDCHEALENTFKNKN